MTGSCESLAGGDCGGVAAWRGIEDDALEDWGILARACWYKVAPSDMVGPVAMVCMVLAELLMLSMLVMRRGASVCRAETETDCVRPWTDEPDAPCLHLSLKFRTLRSCAPQSHPLLYDFVCGLRLQGLARTTYVSRPLQWAKSSSQWIP